MKFEKLWAYAQEKKSLNIKYWTTEAKFFFISFWKCYIKGESHALVCFFNLIIYFYLPNIFKHYNFNMQSIANWNILHSFSHLVFGNSVCIYLISQIDNHISSHSELYWYWKLEEQVQKVSIFLEEGNSLAKKPKSIYIIRSSECKTWNRKKPLDLRRGGGVGKWE